MKDLRDWRLSWTLLFSLFLENKKERRRRGECGNSYHSSLQRDIFTRKVDGPTGHGSEVSPPPVPVRAFDVQQKLPFSDRNFLTEKAPANTIDL